MLVSVGIPFYNAEKYLGFAIQSVINQSFTDWELILVDDGSKDGSLKIANTLSKKDARIKVVSDFNNKGLSCRLNQLTALSQGKYIARMDADDIMHPERLACQVAYLEAHKDIDIVGSLAYSIDSQNNIFRIRGKTKIPANLKEFLRYSFLIHPSIMGKKVWFDSNPYDLLMNRMEDYELWLRTFKHTKFAILDKPLLFYREIDVPSAEKYTLTSKGIQKLLYSLANNNALPKSIAYPTILAFHIKNIIYQIMSGLNIETIILKPKKISLTPQEAEAANTLLKMAIFE